MKLEEVNTCKTFKYTYYNLVEKEEHKKYMLTAQFAILYEDVFTVLYAQIIK